MPSGYVITQSPGNTNKGEEGKRTFGAILMCARIFDNDSTRQHGGGREDLGGKKGFLSGQCVMAARREPQRGHLSETKAANPKEPFVKPGTSTGVRARAQPERHKPVKKPLHVALLHTRRRAIPQVRCKIDQDQVKLGRHTETICKNKTKDGR